MKIICPHCYVRITVVDNNHKQKVIKKQLKLRIKKIEQYLKTIKFWLK